MYGGVDAACKLIGIEVHRAVGVAYVMQSVATPLLYDLHIVLLVTQQFHIEFYLRVYVLVLTQETTLENAHLIDLYFLVLCKGGCLRCFGL